MREYVLLCYLSVLGNPVETIAESKAKIWSVKCFISPPPPHTHKVASAAVPVVQGNV